MITSFMLKCIIVAVFCSIFGPMILGATALALRLLKWAALIALPVGGLWLLFHDLSTMIGATLIVLFVVAVATTTIATYHKEP